MANEFSLRVVSAHVKANTETKHGCNVSTLIYPVTIFTCLFCLLETIFFSLSNTLHFVFSGDQLRVPDILLYVSVYCFCPRVVNLLFLPIVALTARRQTYGWTVTGVRRE